MMRDRIAEPVDRYQERAVEEPRHYDILQGSATAATATTASVPSDAKANITGSKDVPALNGQQKMLVLRARSKLERDQWCWALNVEMERLVRLHSVREAVVRQQGNVLPSSSLEQQ
jgi:Pleckstrin homology domain